jgi:transposase
VAARHAGGGLGLVDEDEALGFEVDLAVEPMPTLPQDVGMVLLDRVPGLFCA